VGIALRNDAFALPKQNSLRVLRGFNPGKSTQTAKGDDRKPESAAARRIIRRSAIITEQRRDAYDTFLAGLSITHARGNDVVDSLSPSQMESKS
jgi:hypothetical protein